MMIRHLLRIGFIISLLGLGGAAGAHEIRPAIATATFAPDGRFDITVSANLEALVAGIGPQHGDTNEAPNAGEYDRLRAVPPTELKALFDAFAPRWLDGISVEFDGTRVRPAIGEVRIPAAGDLALARISVVHLSGSIPAGAKTFQWQYKADFGSSVIRAKRAGDDADQIVASWLKEGAKSAAIPLGGAAEKSTLETVVEYIVLGFTHIVPGGLDHILFVLGLYLLSLRVRPLLVQVTAFTVAHSITLGLGLYGVIQISPAIVEPLIAASIVYVAVENILTTKLHPWRPFVVFGFGLLHGLGFAGVLHEIGLPRADYVIGLISFNVGVELGQLAVIAAAFVATGLWFRSKSWYRPGIVVPASVVIAATGAFWTVQRIFFV